MTETLADKVATFDPSVPDWEVADALNAPDATLPLAHKDVPISSARGILITSGSWPKIVLAAENTATPVELRSLCITTRDAMIYLDNMSTSDPEVYASIVAICDGLLAATLISQATHTKLVALADRQQSWADVNNNGVAVTSRDVGLARGAKD